MRQLILAGLWTVMSCVVPWAGAAYGQADRRQRTEPGLIVETGARMATCDQLTFTPNGQFLLAAGDDKVVRIWNYARGGLDVDNVQTLRWGIWREQRGSIYSIALSPDAESRHVAAAGFGLRVDSVVVIDRVTGNIVHALTDTKAKSGEGYTVRALAFSPSGNQVAYGTTNGALGLWNLKGDKANDVRRIGTHRGLSGEEFNRVRLIHFLDEKQIVSVAQDGQVLLWNLRQNEVKPLFEFKTPRLYRVSLSEDGKWLAAAGEKNQLEIRSFPDGKKTIDITLPRGQYPHALAFNRTATTLAVSYRIVPTDAAFHKESSTVILYDLTEQPPRATRGPTPTYRADALAFHPDGKFLAMAGGNDHEVTLWTVPGIRKVSETRGAGSSLWGVGLSKNGRFLGYRDQRDPDPASPNQWGKGKWRIFDLQQRKWGAPIDDFQPLAPVEKLGGWTVQPSKSDAHEWFVVGPNGVSHLLPIDRDRDQWPRCYTFLRPVAPGKPIRLAVGHYWGLSIFEVSAQSVRRIRLCTGHQGEVTAVAPSDDHKWLVSASRDQTIAAWNLADWPSQSELGARFQLQQGKIVVTDVDQGSPAWEAGLSKGDEIVLFAFNATEFLYDPQKSVTDTRRFKKLGTAEECLDRLRRPVPGLEFYFRVKRAGEAKPLDQLTTVRNRPAWRFFPTRDGEWVLWRWLDYYYDTSTQGDSYIGWHVNSGDGDVDKKPAFYRAEQFRKVFHRPDKVAEVLAKIWKDDQVVIVPDRQSIPRIEPAVVSMRDVATQVTPKEDKVTVTLLASPRGPLDGQKLAKAILWVNDYRMSEWDVGAKAFQQKVEIPRSLLRRGANQLTFQCYNKAGARSNNATVTVKYDAPESRPNLYGLVVGINDYSKAPEGPRGELWPDLQFAGADAEMMKEIWEKQKEKLYGNVEITLLLEQKATREAILDQIKALAAKVKPDDRVIIFLGGHGYADKNKLGSFAYCSPTFDIRRPDKTGVTSQDLYERLSALPCRKLLLLDACHSGDVLQTNPIRDLTPDQVGPVILAACGAKESAVEDSDERKHGLFTWAVHEVLTKNVFFAAADLDKNGKLDTDELSTFVKHRVPMLLENVKDNIIKRNAKAKQRLSDDELRDLREATQNPIAFVPPMERLPLAEEQSRASR